MDPYVILIGGGILSALCGLAGIAMTKRDNTPVVELLDEAELRSYWNQRLVTEGISLCTMGKHEFRPGPGASITVCEICLPPTPKPSNGKWEPHAAPAHPQQRLNFGRAYQPLTWLYEREDDE